MRVWQNIAYYGISVVCLLGIMGLTVWAFSLYVRHKEIKIARAELDFHRRRAQDEVHR